MKIGEEEHEQIGIELLAQVKTTLGLDEFGKLTADERTLLSTILMDAAALQVMAMGFPQTEPFQSRLLREKRVINSSIADITSIAADRVETAVWTSVQWVLQKALTIALAAV